MKKHIMTIAIVAFMLLASSCGSKSGKRQTRKENLQKAQKVFVEVKKFRDSFGCECEAWFPRGTKNFLYDETGSYKHASVFKNIAKDSLEKIAVSATDDESVTLYYKTGGKNVKIYLTQSTMQGKIWESTAEDPWVGEDALSSRYLSEEKTEEALGEIISRWRYYGVKI